jgi:hypothetical protein
MIPVRKKIRSRAHEEKVMRRSGTLIFATRELRETRGGLDCAAGGQAREVLMDERCIHGLTVGG